MSFLDRFKPTPKWRHTDPTIRLAGVADLPDDPEHWAVLAELAASDEDIRIRRAAMGRISAVGYLARLARTERDESLRRELADRLVAIATAPAETDGDAAQAMDGLSEQKHFAAVAKSSPHDTIRTAALGRLHDVKALASVARHAVDPQIALDALARVTDPGELGSVALKTDHKEAGITALERAVEGRAAETDRRELLDEVAARAKNKSVAKRARAMLQELDEAKARRQAAVEEWTRHASAVLSRLSAVAATPDAPDAAGQIGDVEREWEELTSGEFKADAKLSEEFLERMDEARQAIARHAQEEADRRSEAERAAARRAELVALCERVETLRGDDTLDELEKARGEWEGMPGASPQELHDAELRAQFDEACRRATERYHRRQELQRIHARLDELASEAERLSTEDDPEGANQAAWQAVIREWQGLLGPADGPDAAILTRFSDAEARVRQRAEDKRAAAERALKQQIQRVEQLVERTLVRAAAEDLTLREADRAVRDLRGTLEKPPQMDSRAQHVLVDRLKAALAVVAPRLHELREMDEWKRFANAAVQEELIAKAEALRTKYVIDNPDGQKPEDIEHAARELHEIQTRWKQVAEAPRAQAQALWHRYRQAADPIQVKAREFFAQRAEERGANLQLKNALVVRAEALADSTDWIKTADELKKLQAEWQKIGPIPRQDTKDTWKRFREACDRFFTRRNADLAQRKETWSANLARKDALCARAEELAASREWEKAASEIRRLQAEWKTIGPVRRTKSEAIWQRFRAACDMFFERYKRRDDIELEAKQADREALVTEMESLAGVTAEPSATAEPTSVTDGKPSDVAIGEPSDVPVGEPSVTAEAVATAGPPPDLLERVRSLRSRWNQTTPVVRQGADPLSARFVNALERLLTGHPEAFRSTELDIEASRQKMEKLCAKVEGFATETAKPTAGSQALADMLREALASNTIGGRAGEESKWRAMAEEVRQAQSSWSRLGPVPGESGRQLNDRFHRACNRFFEQHRRRVPSQSQPQRKPVGAR
jgi:Domain of Unknown Function (DUF349)